MHTHIYRIAFAYIYYVALNCLCRNIEIVIQPERHQLTTTSHTHTFHNVKSKYTSLHIDMLKYAMYFCYIVQYVCRNE